MRLLIMGPPGAGKGTQATAVALHYRVPAISSGAIFRDNIDRRTPLGLKVEALIAVGDFVPDVITSSLVFARLLEPDCATGWLLDGYPRTLGQVEALERRRFVGAEAQVAVDGGEARVHVRDPGTGRRVAGRHDHLQIRMAGAQPEQLGPGVARRPCDPHPLHGW